MSSSDRGRKASYSDAPKSGCWFRQPMCQLHASTQQPYMPTLRWTAPYVDYFRCRGSGVNCLHPYAAHTAVSVAVIIKASRLRGLGKARKPFADRLFQVAWGPDIS